MLTSLLPPSACATCRLCCNFLPESRWELPALEPACAAHLRSLGVPLDVRPEGGETLALPLSPCPAEAANCPLLDASSGCRLPRDSRPLECRLWPLRLMRTPQGELVVACYRSCPGLAEVDEESLLALVYSLLPLFRERAGSFPESIRPLYPHYRVLLSLNESPALPSNG